MALSATGFAVHDRQGMTDYDTRFWGLAAGLAGLAGFVDAIGFLKLGGLFVSFMSGNSTRLAVGLATHSAVWHIAVELIGSFVLGVMTGSYAAMRAGGLRKPIVLVVVLLLLTAAAIADGYHCERLVVLLLAAAMGAENAVFQRDGEVSIGVTYMTGTLVKLGQRATSALTGGPPFGWLPYLLLWCGLVGGAVIGANLYTHIGHPSLWGAPAAALLLALYAAWLAKRSNDTGHRKTDADRFGADLD